MEAKPFSIGVRIEHPQSLIDRARFGPFAGHPHAGCRRLQAGASLRNGRSAYSFCMCPGGTVVAAASEPGSVVTNGMSQYSRNERNANAAHRGWHHAGGRLSGRTDALAGIEFQRHWESAAFIAGGSNTRRRRNASAISWPDAPRPRLARCKPSYTPGVVP
jgi:uncharacterized FAD-dependent dehydrogenase